MAEQHASGIVAQDCRGESGVKIGAMNLMIGGTESFDIIGAGCPDFDHLAGLKMPYRVGLGGAGLLRDLFADAEEVQCVHRVGRDHDTGADLAKLARLFEYADTIAKMLKSERGAQTSDAASHDENP